MVKGALIYEGKAKKIYSIANNNNLVWVEFKDSLTAFNGEKKAEMAEKGRLNSLITGLIFNRLSQSGVDTHLKEVVSDKEMICQKVKIIPLEVVVRNVLAGSTAKKFNIPEGTSLEKPLVEFYYKNDELGDPFISDDQALMLKAADSQEELNQLKQKALQVNVLLKDIFAATGIRLVDFKLEYGKNMQGEIILADEITPDTCRLWDMKTGEKLDKDRFRRDLGKVLESYQEVYNRLKNI
ncbi:MAG: phosphoribosylaminoimidazolesuccinocarboxamide synthase [Bdellovibrionales bacterium]|nr:phosphoribosylaminoimidazolesuccinocarboxamide synthase [Bdellovibrionales bacterium]